MKVAFIGPSRLPIPATKGGAVETLISNLIEINEVHKKLKITIFTPYEKTAVKQAKDYRFSQFYWIKRGLKYKFFNFFCRIIRKIIPGSFSYFDVMTIAFKIKRLRIDYIVVECGSFRLLEIAKFIPKEKLIFHIHADFINKRSLENEKVMQSVSKTIVGSEYIKKQILQNTSVPSSLIKVLPIGINIEDFNISGEESGSLKFLGFKIPENFPLVLFVGRVVQPKGINELISALERIKGKVSFNFIIVGSFGSGFGLGDEGDQFSLDIRKRIMDNSDWIFHTGFIHNSNLPIIYSISDLVVVPSLCEEASGLVAMEAMASGKPLIITDSGGMPEYITHDCAVVVKRDERLVENLSDAILYLLQNKEKCEVMGKAGRINSARFSSRKYYDGFLEILNGVM